MVVKVKNTFLAQRTSCRATGIAGNAEYVFGQQMYQGGNPQRAKREEKRGNGGEGEGGGGSIQGRSSGRAEAWEARPNSLNMVFPLLQRGTRCLGEK